MNQKSIYISSVDYRRLRGLASAVATGKSAQSNNARHLLAELDRAIMLGSHEMPPGVVQVDSRVTIEDLTSGEVDEYTLTLPDRANAEEGRLSVLAPIGTALLGYSTGDELTWETPGGVRRLRIREVAHPDLVAA